MKKILIIIACLLLLACTTTKTEIVYKNVYPELPELSSPLVLSLNACEFIMPENEDSKIFVGFDEENYKCYLKNQEINREQKVLYEKFINEINSERKQWKALNQKNNE